MKSAIKHLTSFLGTLAFLLIAFASGDADTTTPTSEVSDENIVSVGESLTTDYFEIKVNKVTISDKVATGNQFSDVSAEPGNSFLIFNVTFKNIDGESRLFQEGEVMINYNNKDYRFDTSETIMAEGWGSFFDQINPLTSKTTNLVYKIPTEIKGPAYWKPGRNSKGKLFLLGNIE